ncbi:hypothetical protein [Olleya sp. UBA1516]|uniref:hypothetical protein n=1 Tax=Olleya sp. UBA1516 TaxID=1947013 RepID=UPI0025F928E7|nr:hypothetical protein [Olleya sp. UBA1516]|tara:strand:+ start:1005 stop:1607 length:603 start_codon:yes stop_codon:yes gene_type:complete
MQKLKIFYTFVIISSILTLFNNGFIVLNLSAIVSVLGIVASILFFAKKFNFYYVAILWIVAQIPYVAYQNDIFDLSQFLHFHLAITIGQLSIGVNAQVILLGLIIKDILLSRHLFKTLTFNAYTENDILKREDFYSFIPIDIKSKKLIGVSEIVIENVAYTNIQFVPLQEQQVKKASIVMSSFNEENTIKATVQYSITKS